MDQLIVLHEIYDSFSKGSERIKAIDPSAIEGSCSEQMGRLLEGAKIGKIDQDICSCLLDCFDDVYELKRLGDICRKAGHYVVAINSYNKALSKNVDQSIQPVLLNNLGQVYVRSGDLENANIYYKRAFDCFEAAGDSSGMAHILGNIAAVYRRGKDWDKAIDHCYRGLKIFEGLGDDLGVARATGRLGRIYADMGEQDLAIRYFDKSLNDFRRLGDNRSVAWILNRLGQISSAAKNWDEAFKYYNKSIMIFEELGQDKSMGMTISNLGRMYLEKGDVAAAIENLEKAMKFLKRDMQPAYQNAVECIAAAYGALATMHMQSAESSFSGRLSDNARDKLKQASQLYARSSDRYLEIASTRGFDLPERKVSAGIMRSLSYLARLKAESSAEEAVALAERAASALDAAVINAEGSQKDDIEAFQRILIGIREVLSSGIAEGEPWKMTKSIAKSIEHILSGASILNDADKSLIEVLRGLGGAIEAERQRASPSEHLKSMASSLGRAKSAFKSAGTVEGQRNASEIDKAMKLADGMINIESSNSMRSSYDRVSDFLNYRAYRDILLIIGGILADEAASMVNRIDRIYVWDESSDPSKRSAEKESVTGKPDEDEGKVGSFSDILPSLAPDVVDLDDAAADDGIKIVGDAVAPELSADYRSSEVSLVAASKEIARPPVKVVMLPETDSMAKKVGIAYAECSNASPKRSDDVIGEGDDIVDEAEKPEDYAAAKGRFAKIAGISSIFNQTNAINLIKAMIVVVLVLLAMDTILYLI